MGGLISLAAVMPGMRHLVLTTCLVFVLLISLFHLTLQTEANGWFDTRLDIKTDENRFVLELKEKTLKSRIPKYPAVAILFYVKNNRHCDEARAVFESLAIYWNTSSLAFTQADCLKESAVCTKFGQTLSYPQLVLYFPDTGTKLKYNSMYWNKEHVSSWLHWHEHGSLVDLTPNPSSHETISDSLSSFITASPHYVLGLFSVYDRSYGILSKVARSMKNTHRFGTMQFADMVSLREGGVWPGVPIPPSWPEPISKISTPSAILLHFEGTTHVKQLQSKTTEKELKEWITRRTKSLLHWVDLDNMNSFSSKKTPVVIYLSTLGRNPNQISEKVFSCLKKVASKLSSKAQFVYTDEAVAQNWKQMHQLEQYEGDVIVIYHPAGFIFVYPQNQPIKTSAIEKWIESVLDGKVASHKLQGKGYPTHYPANERNLVVRLTSSNWDQMIGNSKVDTLVAFLQPWHAASKRLWPIWVEIARASGHQLHVAQFDAHANTIPVEVLISKYNIQISKYPTVVLFKTDGTAQIHDGTFTIESILKFVQSK